MPIASLCMLQDGRDWDIGQLSAASQRLVLGWSFEFVQVSRRQEGVEDGGSEQPITRRSLHRSGEVRLQPLVASSTALPTTLMVVAEIIFGVYQLGLG